MWAKPIFKIENLKSQWTITLVFTLRRKPFNLQLCFPMFGIIRQVFNWVVVAAPTLSSSRDS